MSLEKQNPDINDIFGGNELLGSSRTQGHHWALRGKSDDTHQSRAPSANEVARYQAERGAPDIPPKSSSRQLRQTFIG